MKGRCAAGASVAMALALATPSFAQSGPNDPLFAAQWSLRNTGQSGAGAAGIPGADTGAIAAWRYTWGSTSVRVALLDSGAALDHPDLRSNLWLNRAEAGRDAAWHDRRSNGVDDDRNGYVDDWRGWDVVDDDNEPADASSTGHGTHVSGILGARGGNRIGISGLARYASMMEVRVSGPVVAGLGQRLVDGIGYAARNGARVVNINAALSGAAPSELADALAEHPAILFVVAAGNGRADLDGSATHWLCDLHLANVLCVAATDRRDELSSFSNWGRLTVDLTAPGSDILSSLPGAEYGSLSGTSMATPHVSAVAALLLAQRPASSPADLRRWILGGTDRIPALQTKVASGGRLSAAGSLRLQAQSP